jgi:hypothetical protein
LIFNPSRQIFLSLPVKSTIIFSSPDNFYMISTGLSIGYHIGVRK